MHHSLGRLHWIHIGLLIRRTNYVWFLLCWKLDVLEILSETSLNEWEERIVLKWLFYSRLSSDESVEIRLEQNEIKQVSGMMPVLSYKESLDKSLNTNISNFSFVLTVWCCDIIEIFTITWNYKISMKS